MSESTLLAQLRAEQERRIQAERERDQARANFRRAFGIVQGIYTSTGVRTFVVSGKVYEWHDEPPDVTLGRLRTLLRAIPLQVQRMHEASPPVPRAQWHPTLPLELETRPAPYYAATEPAPLYLVTRPMEIER